ncbi:MAG TPA: hypothetical protein VGL42_10740 [Opitutaceae bacterium]
MNFAKKSRKLARALFWRDIRELLAAALLMFLFVKDALHRGSAGWPIWLGIALLVPVAGFFVKERIRAHYRKTAPNASVLEKVEADLAELRRQRSLLQNVGKWYLGPIFLSWLVVLASTHFHGLGGILRTPLQMSGYAAGGVALFYFIWKLNRRAVRRQIDPRISELETLKIGLLAGNSG